MRKHKTEAELTPEEREDAEVLYALRRKGKNAIRFNIVLQIITLLTAVGSLLFFFFEDERGLDITINHIFQCIGALIILNIPLFIQRKFKCYIPNSITVILYIYIFAHFVLGEIYRAYDHVFLYDKILHATGGLIFATLSFSVVWLLNNREGNRIKLSPLFIVLFTFCFTMTAEYLWELIEYGADRLFGLNMQRWQDSIIEGAQIVVDGQVVDGTAHSVPYGNGLKDTMGDMIMNIIGCLVGCAVSYAGMRMRPHWFENKVILTEKQFRAMLEREADGKDGDAPVVDFVYKVEKGEKSAREANRAMPPEDQTGKGAGAAVPASPAADAEGTDCGHAAEDVSGAGTDGWKEKQ